MQDEIKLRQEAIKILELHRYMDINYTKGTERIRENFYIRRFISHKIDPIPEEKIKEKIEFIKYINSKPIIRHTTPVEINPNFDYTILENLNDKD